MRVLLILVSLLYTVVGAVAQDFRSTGEFKSDVSGSTTRNAWLELSLSQNYKSLRLLILPGRDAEVTESLVDTIWISGAPYRNGDPVVADKYEEKDAFFLYNIDRQGCLLDYYVFSRFIDTTQKDLQQIVVRKFAADGKRIWCMTMNTNNERAKTFFNILNEARKKMKFKKTTSVKGGHKLEKEYVEPRIYTPGTTIGRGSTYGSGW